MIAWPYIEHQSTPQSEKQQRSNRSSTPLEIASELPDGSPPNSLDDEANSPDMESQRSEPFGCTSNSGHIAPPSIPNTNPVSSEPPLYLMHSSEPTTIPIQVQAAPRWPIAKTFSGSNQLGTEDKVMCRHCGEMVCFLCSIYLKNIHSGLEQGLQST